MEAILKAKLEAGKITQSEYDHLMAVDAQVRSPSRWVHWAFRVAVSGQ